MRHWTVGNLLRNKLHGRTVPTIKRGYSIEILAFTVIFLDAPTYRSPPHIRLQSKRKNRLSPKQKTENFHSLSFIFILDLFFRDYCRSIRSRMSKNPSSYVRPRSRSLSRGNRCTFCRSSWLL